MAIADNLIGCNHHFQTLAKTWRAQGKKAGPTRVKVALRFARISFQSPAGRCSSTPACRGGTTFWTS
jgi:hypothetical protein